MYKNFYFMMRSASKLYDNEVKKILQLNKSQEKYHYGNIKF